MEISFKNKRILVTGAGAGLGKSLAIELWRSGASVVALSLIQAELDTLNQEYPEIQTVQVDLSNWDETRKIVEGLGYFDGLVNNAGIVVIEPFLDTSVELFDKTMSINVRAILNVSQVVAKKMVEKKNGGAIVHISSQASMAAFDHHVAYCTSKAAVDGMTRVMALELGPHNIRVNTVNPTVMMTDVGRRLWSDPEKSAPMLAKTPLRRFAEVSEVVNAVLFLLSDKASMVTGINMPVDGGYLAL